MSWDSYDLLTKASLYIDRAHRNRDSDDSGTFVLWYILALELLSRSAIAYVSPVLLANPNQVKNLYYAIGRSDLCEYPMSVPARTVYERCETLFTDFTRSEREYCNALRELRNAEIHSGESVLESIPYPNWQLRYYRSSRILLETMNKDLEDLFPPELVPSILEMLEVNEQEEKAAVKKLLAAARVHAKTQDIDLEQYRQSLEYITPKDIDLLVDSDNAVCPVCRSYGMLGMKRVSLSDTKLVNDLLMREATYMPIEFSCTKCKLELDSYERMVMAEMGDPFIANVEIDMMELFMEYLEPDYGND